MRKLIRGALILIGGLVGLLVIAIAAALVVGELSFKKVMDRPLYQLAADTSPEGIARGEYLVRKVMGCADCHGPSEIPSDNVNANLVGRYQNISMGPISAVFAAPNLTPDQETGLGGWTDAEIARAIREGVDHEGKALVVMPSFNYHGIPDSDIAAIIGYLRSLEPVQNEIPEFSGNSIMKAVVAFNLLGPSSVGEPILERQENNSSQGEYLVQIGGCRDCHGENLAGGPVPFSPPDAVPAANLTPGGELAGWTSEDFLTTIRTGVTPSGRVLDKAMPIGVYGQMTDEDLLTIFDYLKSVPRAVAKR